MTKLILFLFRLLPVSKQQEMTRYLVSVVFPGDRIYKARPAGYKRPRDPFKTTRRRPHDTDQP